MNQYLILNFLGPHGNNLPEKISKAIRELGGNITECRLSKMGSDLSGLIMVEGGWDAIAKIEALLPKLGADLKLQIHCKRTEKNKSPVEALPYAIDIVSSQRPGLLHEISRFMAEHGIEIHDLYTTTHPSIQTGTPMFTLHMAVNIPVTVSIASLRGEFMEFCDSFNLDAIMEPSK